MPETIERSSRFGKRTRLLHEIAFSIYFCRLLIMMNAFISIQHPARNSWGDDLQLLITGDRFTAYHNFASTTLWAISAAVLFLCLRVLANLSIVDLFLRIFGGIVAVAGFPLVAGYISFRGYLHMPGSFPRALLYAYAPNRWLAVEVMASLVCVFSYVFLRWPPKARWGLLLLGLHFSLWTWFAFIGGNQPLIYLLLGLLASIAWGLYVWQPAANSTLKAGQALSDFKFRSAALFAWWTKGACL